MSKTKILLFASNPDDTDPLALDEEVRSITKKIRESEFRDSIEFVTMLAARPTDLLDGLSQHKPTIVHFSGHGAGKEGLVFKNEDGGSSPVSSKALKMLFSSLKDNIRLVVLNACLSDVQARAIAENIDCVVGMKESIGDEAAITFAAYFYSGLGFGRSVKEAFDQGIAAIMLNDIPGESIPVIIPRKGIDPGSIILVNAAPDQHSRPSQQYDKHALREAIGGNLNIDELNLICADINDAFERDNIPEKVSQDIVGGNNFKLFVLHLIEYLERRDLLNYLVDEVKKSFPTILS